MKKIFTLLTLLIASITAFAQDNNAIAVPAPKAVNLGDDTEWIPLFIQGVITSNFQQYSGLTVIDRQNADMVKAEQKLSESAAYDEANAIEVGKLTSARFIITGNIMAKSNAYALTFSITDAQTGETKASANVPNCLRSALEDGSAANQISYDLMTGYGIALGADARSKLTQKASAMTAQTSAQVSVAKGIVAEQGGSNIEALTYYIQARKNDKNFKEATIRMNGMTTVVTSGSFGANAKNLIKLRNDWDKLLRETAELIASNPPEFELYYFTDIEARELTAADYENGTMSFTVTMPRMMEISAAGNDKIAGELMTAMRKIEQSRNWGDKINGFPWSYADDIPGDNWLKSVKRGSETYSFTASLFDGKKKVIAKTNISFTVRFKKKYSDFDISSSASLLQFTNVAVNDADTDKLYIAVENAGSKKLSVLPVYGMPVDKAIRILRSGDHNGTVKIGGFWGRNSLNDIVQAVKSSKKAVALDLSELFNITEIPESAFKDCSSLTSIVLPENVTQIGESAFYNCNSLTNIKLPDSGTYISDYLFSNCRSLINIDIPISVIRIGRFAFYNCSSLETITFAGTKKQWIEVMKNKDWNYDVPAKKVICSDGEANL